MHQQRLDLAQDRTGNRPNRRLRRYRCARDLALFMAVSSLFLAYSCSGVMACTHRPTRDHKPKFINSSRQFVHSKVFFVDKYVK